MKAISLPGSRRLHPPRSHDAKATATFPVAARRARDAVPAPGLHRLPDAHAHRDRSAPAIDAGGVLPGYQGVIVRDGYAGYSHLTGALHAWCRAPAAPRTTRASSWHPLPAAAAERCGTVLRRW
jgi:Transposase IS66 family